MNIYNIWNKKQKDNLLLSPIYKLHYFQKRRNTFEDQTSAGSMSEHSFLNNKKIQTTNKSISLLNIPANLTNLISNNLEKKNFKSILKKDILKGNNTNSLPEISNIESNESIHLKTDKSRNNVFLKNLKLNNIRSETDIKQSNKIKPNKSYNNFRNKIQHLLKNHRINKVNKKNYLNFSPNLLISDNDLTRKRFFFGFMNQEKTNIKEENIKSEMNKNKSLEKNKKTIHYTTIKKKKYSPLKVNKNTKVIFTIDQLLKKTFKNPNDDKLILQRLINPKKKIKLKPLSKPKLQINNKNSSSINIFSRNKKTHFLTNKLTNNKCLSEKELKEIKYSNLRTNQKKHSMSTKILPKTVRFKEGPIKLSSNLNEKKKTIRNELRKKSERTLSEKINPENFFGYNFELEELEDYYRYDYEDSNFNTESEEEKKRKRKLKEKKKFRNRISSSTLNLSQKIIKTYEIFNFTRQEKNFLIKLHPENLIIKKFMTSNYTNILNKTKSYINRKIKLKEKNYFSNFHYSEDMFFISKYDKNESIDFHLNINKNKIKYKEYVNMGLNTAIAFHLMNLYLLMSPQIIANFLSAKPEEKDKDLKYIFRSDKNIQKRKSVPDINTKIMYDIMGLTKENIVFYQRFIYIDYETFLFEKIEQFMKNTDNNEENYKGNKNNKEKNRNITIPKKRRKVHLEILRKKPFFKMEGKQRQIMASILDDYLKTEDITLKTLVENIKIMSNTNVNNPKLIPTIIMLLDYCIRHQSHTLFFRFHHRYHNYFDINSVDFYSNNDTLLIKATKENSNVIVKYLLEKGADPNMRNNFGNTAMHYAISYKYFRIADILRKNGAREDIENVKGLIPWECVNRSCE